MKLFETTINIILNSDKFPFGNLLELMQGKNRPKMIFLQRGIILWLNIDFLKQFWRT